MNTMTLYFLTDKDMGNNVLLHPRIPDTAPEGYEDTITERICCSPSITGCINSTEVVFGLPKDGKGKDFYLYGSNVPVEKIYQPNIDQVHDTWRHAEFWVTEEQSFFLLGKYHLSKQFDFPNSSLSRYQFVKCDDESMVPDRVNDTCVYGDMDAFSFIELEHDEKRMRETRKYFEENHIIP